LAALEAGDARLPVRELDPYARALGRLVVAFAIVYFGAHLAVSIENDVPGTIAVALGTIVAAFGVDRLLR
jgi:hypothetical protein